MPHRRTTTFTPPTAAVHRSVDVVVVGAGMAGLACARALHRRGADTIVLEARARVGGRVLTTSADGRLVELGGQFIGPGQSRAYALAAELGLHPLPTHASGRHLVEDTRGRPHRYAGSVPHCAPHALLDVALALRQFEHLARTIDCAAPWRSPHAARLDAATLGDWIRRHVRTRHGRRLFTLACEAVWSAQPAELSLLHALFYARAAGSFDALLRTEGGAQQDHLAEGAQALALRMADQLAGRVRLETAVRSITQHDGTVRVRTADGDTWRARHVVVAVPPTLACRIHYDPPLPAERDALTQRLPMGSVVKCVALYPAPFWRRENLSGQVTSLCGPMRAAFDSSPRDASYGVLLGFVEGSAARAHARRSPGDRRAAVTAQLARLFGPRAGEPQHYTEVDWAAEPWTRGGYAALFPPGAWTLLGPALRRPVGRIHWAGTETSTRWCGYIEGALDSAHRVCAEITAAEAG
nr:flavin monoamine oxidase family protein [Streptomyces orinoci]